MKTDKFGSPRAEQFETLGAFYLGGIHRPETGTHRDQPLLYDSKDLTTHAVCVGMTGSGKTGLCVSLIEEAAIDGIPAIIIDPKGDLGNLALSFPSLAGEDFEPWIDPQEAATRGQTVSQLAEKTADLWHKGLDSWGQDSARIQRFKDAAELRIYTPGSSAGLPLTMLRSFDPPPAELREDAEALRAHLTGIVTGLLGLLGIDADPVRSREFILLCTIIDKAWSDERSLELEGLIREIQNPPFDRIGVMDLESVYSAKDRFTFAMQVNNLMASPGFSAWREGEAMDPRRLLWNESGKPRISIISIAHLDDAQRMFVVTTLLGELIAWMRTQSGTPSLRALLYMDEVYGYLPPSAKPPSKQPLLTLLKQARAFGLGLVLATQNPVDLDYKALSNAGTWFLGRLQTERDKMRVLDGLEGASTSSGSSFDRARIDQLLSGLGKRVFLMNNVHEGEPVLFHTRWVLSYLRGPLTREQIRRLMTPLKEGLATAAAAKTGVSAVAASRKGRLGRASSTRPVLPAGVEEYFLAPRRGVEGALKYRPCLLGVADLHFAQARTQVDFWKTLQCLVPLHDQVGTAPWTGSEWLDAEPDLLEIPVDGAVFLPLPARAMRAKSYDSWARSLKTYLYREAPLTLRAVKALKLISRPEESEAEFQVRLQETVRERRDLEVAKLRGRFAPKLARLEERIQTAQRRVERESSQYSHQKLQTAISIGATVLGALLGRKASAVGRASTSLRGASRAARERGDISRAQDQVAELQEKLALLESEFEEQLAGRQETFSLAAYEPTEVLVRPRKTDSSVSRVALVWVPREG